MHDKRQDGHHGGDVTARDNAADSLGALISAAGKRAAPPQNAYTQVFAAAHEAWQRKVRTRVQRRLGYALAATIAALAVGITFMIQMGPGALAPIIASAGVIQGDVRVQGPADAQWRQLGRSTGPIVAGTRLRTMQNGRVALTLSGDASLRVDAATELTLTADREIELAAGTLYIDSGAGNDAGPFHVTTPLGAVSDIGTQFEVAAFDDGLRVRVRDGAVRIDGATDMELVASAGDQISLGMDGSIGRDYVLPFDSAWAWIETLADAPEIEGRSLILFLAWVTRETGRELRFDAPATEARARTVILHGSADNLTPMRALDIMLSTTDFDYALGSDGAIVISPRPSSR